MKCTLLFTLSWGAVAFTPAATIYDNSQTDTGYSVSYTANAYSQIGDQITLGGTDRYLNSANVQFYNNALTSGTFTAILRFWNAGSPVGSQIGGDFTLNLSINANAVLTVGFANLNLDVTGTNNLIFTVEVQNAGSLDLMLNQFEGGTPGGPIGPGPGASDNTFFIARDAGGFFQALPSPVDQGNLFFQLNASASAVPEPSSLALLSGAALAGLWRLRRKSA